MKRCFRDEGQCRGAIRALFAGTIGFGPAWLGENPEEKLRSALQSGHGSAEFKVLLRIGLGFWEEPEPVRWSDGDGLPPGARQVTRRLFQSLAQSPDAIDRWVERTDAEYRERVRARWSVPG